jgi:CRISPR-associated endonuclease/helicase Cas3
MSIMKYIWAKSVQSKTVEGDSIQKYHPLICHMLDSAAMTEMIWDMIISKPMKQIISRSFQRSLEFTRKIIIVISGCHDIGKSSPSFQSKIAYFRDILKQNGLDFEHIIDHYHSILSGVILQRYLKPKLDKHQTQNFISQLFSDIKRIIGAHHGKFPNFEMYHNIEASSNNPIDIGGVLWEELQNNMIDLVCDYAGLSGEEFQSFLIKGIENKGDISERSKKNAEYNSSLMFLAGLITISDWIASNETNFEFYTDFSDIAELKTKYFPIAKNRANKSLENLKWKNWIQKAQIAPNDLLTFDEIFNFSSPRPLQSIVIEKCKNIDRPSLFLIEAPMGEGKTEAALFIEYYLENKLNLTGSYIALPTQATSNQMFQRVKDFLKKTHKNQYINLHLLHGNAIMSEEYSLLKEKSNDFSSNNAVENQNDDTLVASRWFTYKKRGLISPFGVGTIDQSLLSIIPTKHFFIRIFGLSGKIFIIDEVHAYDVYMSELLERLLEWMRYLGTTVVLLSATLPASKRKNLISAYCAGLNIPNIEKQLQKKAKPYPTVTIINEKCVEIETFNVSVKKQGEDAVQINWISENSISELVFKSISEGGRIAIICNKVKRAQMVYLQLLKYQKTKQSLKEVEIDLLHSRFPYIQRMNVENRLLENFGKNRDHKKSQKKILVSTQIIEQSLDLDFDWMISDLAPIDLMIQRLGRLHRHTKDSNQNTIIRPKNFLKPTFSVIAPDTNIDGIIEWEEHPIYPKHLLLRTFLILKQQQNFTISIPDDLQSLIEDVYGEEIIIPLNFQSKEDEWKNLIQKYAMKQTKKWIKQRKKAKYNEIKSPVKEDYFDNIRDFASDEESSIYLGTRLMMPTVSLVCLYQKKQTEPVNNESFYTFLPNGSQGINLKKIPKEKDIITILQYVVKISNYDVYHEIVSDPTTIPKTWARKSALYEIHCKVLDYEESSDRYFFFTRNYKIYLTEKFGIIQIKKGRDNINDYII